MSDDSHVTRAELAAHIKGIDEHFVVVETSLERVEEKVDQGFKEIADSQWLGPQGRTFVSGAGLVAALASILIAIFH